MYGKRYYLCKSKVQSYGCLFSFGIVAIVNENVHIIYSLTLPKMTETK